eukprot:SAG31_NODE_25858_length_452_cov_2.280453_1_plen_27_part_01
MLWRTEKDVGDVEGLWYKEEELLLWDF